MSDSPTHQEALTQGKWWPGRNAAREGELESEAERVAAWERVCALNTPREAAIGTLQLLDRCDVLRTALAAAASASDIESARRILLAAIEFDEDLIYSDG
jgi:hypothetical protein